MTATPTFHVDLPLEVTFRATHPSTEGDSRWVARLPDVVVNADAGARIGTFTRDELVALGVDVDRLRRHDESEDEYRARRVFETLGLASVCWENPGGAGVFDSTRAADAGRELLDDLGIDPPVGYKVVLAPTETGRVEFHSTGTVDPADWATPDRPEPSPLRAEWLDGPVTVTEFHETAPFDVTDFEVVADTGDEVIPETMFAGTEPQDTGLLSREEILRQIGDSLDVPQRVLLSRLESDEALSVMVNAIGWVALGGDPEAAEGALDATPEQLDDLRLAARRARDHLLAYARRPDIPPPAPETPPAPTWKDCNGAALMVGDSVRDVDSGTVGVLEAAEDKYPPMAARFHAPNGGTYLVIPHADLEAAT